MSALVHQVALVSESNRVKLPDLMRVSAALQKQASRDLEPIWEISATVDAFATLEEVPDGYWPMIIKDNIGTPGAAGVHMDKDGQPFALISSSNTLDEWSLTASHEMCEMLVDPSGDKQATGDSPMPGQERVSFLVEVCDPSEAADFAYSVNGILASDFYTPHYFDPMSASGVRYSFTGAITQPRQVLRGGYLSWKDSVSGHWWQEIWFEGVSHRSATLVQPMRRREAYGLSLIALRQAIPQRRLRADGQMLIKPALPRPKREPRWRRMRQCGTNKSMPSWDGPRAVVQQEQRVGSGRAAKELEPASQ